MKLSITRTGGGGGGGVEEGLDDFTERVSLVLIALEGLALGGLLLLSRLNEFESSDMLVENGFEGKGRKLEQRKWRCGKDMSRSSTSSR